MRPNNKVQMCHTELVDHVVGNVLAVAAVDLAGKAVGDCGIGCAGCVLDRGGLRMSGIHQTPVPVGFHQHHAAFQTVGIHIKIIYPVTSGGMRHRPVLIHRKERGQHQEEGQEIFKYAVPVLHVLYLWQKIADNNSGYFIMLRKGTATTKCQQLRYYINILS